MTDLETNNKPSGALDARATYPRSRGGGAVSFTLASSGKIKPFAFIIDREDGSTLTYANVMNAGDAPNSDLE